MGEKNLFIRYYLSEKIKELKKIGIEINEEEFNKLIEKLSEKKMGTQDLIYEINQEIRKIIEEYYNKKDLVDTYMKKIEQNKEIKDLPIEYLGITLNKQDIDLIRISSAATPSELEDSLKLAYNNKTTLNKYRLTDKEFERTKKTAFELYKSTLEDENDVIADPNIMLRKRLKYIKDSGILTSEEHQLLDNIIEKEKTPIEIIESINETFGSDKSHEIFEIYRECSPNEKTGIKKTTEKASLNLLSQVKNNFNSITIDEEAKYGQIVLKDGICEFRHLKDTLDFANNLGKKVRLNTLIFYMDCPEYIYNMEKSEESKKFAKEKLRYYVDETTKFISKEPYSDTVRSIDIFNELLNRFPLEGQQPYLYRGNIEQTTTSDGKVSDNTKAGWLKHLDLNDLCDIAAVARKNLPNMDFMYNDDNLIDSNKLEATKDIIEQILKYESDHSIKIIDSIGTQMHVDNSITTEEITNMFRELSKFGLPIEITEFDLAMTKNVKGLSSEEIEILRQEKMNEIISCIQELSEIYNIRGFTIWSKTNSQNFRVKLANEELIQKGLEPIESLHGGYFDENMEPKVLEYSKQEKSEYVNDSENNEITMEDNNEIYSYVNNISIDETTSEEDVEGQIDKFTEKVDESRKNNLDTEIQVGVSSDYTKENENLLIKIREKVDYMILSQSFLKKENDSEESILDYPLKYAQIMCKAIESGIFDIVKEPYIFLPESKKYNYEEKEIFRQNMNKACEIICESAKNMNIPIYFNSKMDGENEFSSIFREIAKKSGVKIINYTNKKFENDIEMVTQDYNPIQERRKNKKLIHAYEITKFYNNYEKKEYQNQNFTKNNNINEMDIMFEETKTIQPTPKEQKPKVYKRNKDYSNKGYVEVLSLYSIFAMITAIILIILMIYIM